MSSPIKVLERLSVHQTTLLLCAMDVDKHISAFFNGYKINGQDKANIAVAKVQ